MYLPAQVKGNVITNLKVEIQTDFLIYLVSGMLSLKENYKDIFSSFVLEGVTLFVENSSLWKEFDITTILIFFYLKSVEES